MTTAAASTSTSTFVHRISDKTLPENGHHYQTTICSLTDDLLLECLSRVPHSSLPNISLVCRRWVQLRNSTAFYDLRRSHGHLCQTIFAVAVTESGLYTASHRIGHDISWKTVSFLADHIIPSDCCHGLFSHSRLSAIGPKLYIIGPTAVLRCDTWTGTVTAKKAMIFQRKEFASAVVAGRIYVAGGALLTSEVEEYEPEIDSWRVVADAPRRRYGCIGASLDGVFYVIGGSSSNEISGAAGWPGSDAHVCASSMDLYDVDARGWLRSHAVPDGGCVVAACSAVGHVYILARYAVKLSFWRFDARRNSSAASSGLGNWRRMKSPPLPLQVRLDSTVRFSCVGVGDKVALVMDFNGWLSIRGMKVLVYDCGAGEWSRGTDLPEGIRRAACVCVEC